ncbi:MAG: HAMP domain-containing protein [Elusimicrobia bacterium]|nr:HAMP domain-containing protein [Elusimicrobiota bacterium]MDE2236324.1 HAMP domain-containing protein [Elusimicrobiota bacterium]MDE2424418.1 HAMP domain-containing protein [Elusimicrobiota bacterium]
MSSSLKPRWRASLSVRLILSVAALFAAGDAAVLTTAYLTLASSLRQRDRAEIRAELEDLRGAYEEGGLPGLRGDVEQAGAQAIPFFVRLSAPGGARLFERLPPSPRPFDPSSLDVASRSLKDGALLQVGQSGAEREDVLERFRWIAAAIFLPTVLLSVLFGLWLLKRVVLGPVRRLHEVVEGVLAGKSGSRVPVGRDRGEIESLGELFNRMLDRIESLIAAMKGSLDVVAHDLRTPITRLRSGAEAALSGKADLAGCREALADCVEEADRVSTMLTTLMDISEAESGAMTLRLERVSLDELAAEAAELYRYAAEGKGVRLKVGAPSGAAALCDRNRMRQVVANLLDNAVKYTPRAGEVEISAVLRAGEAAIAVLDSGSGIPQEELPRVFERLYRGRAARSQRGLGLGLSLVRAVVSAHGGTVEASSPAGGGTLLEVRLPQGSSGIMRAQRQNAL